MDGVDLGAGAGHVHKDSLAKASFGSLGRLDKWALGSSARAVQKHRGHGDRARRAAPHPLQKHLAAATPYLAAARGIVQRNLIKTPRNRANFLGEGLGKKIAIRRGHDARESQEASSQKEGSRSGQRLNAQTYHPGLA